MSQFGARTPITSAEGYQEAAPSASGWMRLADILAIPGETTGAIIVPEGDGFTWCQSPEALDQYPVGLGLAKGQALTMDDATQVQQLCINTDMGAAFAVQFFTGPVGRLPAITQPAAGDGGDGGGGVQQVTGQAPITSAGVDYVEIGISALRGNANLYIDETHGNDDTAVLNDPLHPFKTIQRAYLLNPYSNPTFHIYPSASGTSNIPAYSARAKYIIHGEAIDKITLAYDATVISSAAIRNIYLHSQSADTCECSITVSNANSIECIVAITNGSWNVQASIYKLFFNTNVYTSTIANITAHNIIASFAGEAYAIIEAATVNVTINNPNARIRTSGILQAVDVQDGELHHSGTSLINNYSCLGGKLTIEGLHMPLQDDPAITKPIVVTGGTVITLSGDIRANIKLIGGIGLRLDNAVVTPLDPSQPTIVVANDNPLYLLLRNAMIMGSVALSHESGACDLYCDSSKRQGSFDPVPFNVMTGPSEFIQQPMPS